MASSSNHDEVSLLIQDVVTAANTPPKSRAANIKPTVANLTSLCYDVGLLPDALSELIDLVTKPSFLDQASLAAIVRNLYPATRVSRDVVLRVVSAMGHGSLKPSLTLQAGLIRWLILVYHVLETPGVLSQAYPVLFNLLDTAVTRPNLCHLLALITRRKHVRPFRIQALLNMSRQTGNDPGLVGLLRVCKDYYPEIIVGEGVRGRASAFKHPDPPWRTRLDEVQDAYVKQSQEQTTQPRHSFRVYRPVNRSQRNKAVPTAHTIHATEDSITLEEIEDAAGFVKQLDKLHLPNQLVAVLADPLLQKLLMLRPSAAAHQRIVNWLSAVLQEFMDGDVGESTLWEVLDVVRDFVVQTKTLPPLLLSFFARFLQVWDGSGRTDIILEMFGFCPFAKFEDLKTHIFEPLETATLVQDPEMQLSILALYTNLLHNWTSFLKAADPIPDHASTTVEGLVRHVNVLALTLMQTSPGNATEFAILSFYEQMVRLVTDNDLRQYIRIELPPSTLVYTFLFSNSLSSMSRSCYILACYKKGFESAMSSKSRNSQSSLIDSLSYDRTYVNLYNGYLMDICNCLWRSRAFSVADTNAQGCLIPRTTVAALTSYVAAVDRGFSLASLFSLSHSPVLCLQTILRLRELEDAAMERDSSIRTRHAGPVTQASLSKLGASGGLTLTWAEYRIDALKELSDNGFAGVTELLKNTMTVLKNSMEGGPKPSQKLR